MKNSFFYKLPIHLQDYLFHQTARLLIHCDLGSVASAKVDSFRKWTLQWILKNLSFFDKWRCSTDSVNPAFVFWIRHKDPMGENPAHFPTSEVVATTTINRKKLQWNLHQLTTPSLILKIPPKIIFRDWVPWQVHFIRANTLVVFTVLSNIWC